MSKYYHELKVVFNLFILSLWGLVIFVLAFLIHFVLVVRNGCLWEKTRRAFYNIRERTRRTFYSTRIPDEISNVAQKSHVLDKIRESSFWRKIIKW